MRYRIPLAGVIVATLSAGMASAYAVVGRQRSTLEVAGSAVSVSTSAGAAAPDVPVDALPGATPPG